MMDHHSKESTYMYMEVFLSSVPRRASISGATRFHTPQLLCLQLVELSIWETTGSYCKRMQLTAQVKDGKFKWSHTREKKMSTTMWKRISSICLVASKWSIKKICNSSPLIRLLSSTVQLSFSWLIFGDSSFSRINGFRWRFMVSLRSPETYTYGMAHTSLWMSKPKTELPRISIIRSSSNKSMIQSKMQILGCHKSEGPTARQSMEIQRITFWFSEGLVLSI